MLKSLLILRKYFVVRWSFLDVSLRSYKTIIAKKIAEFLSSYHEEYKLCFKTMQNPSFVVILSCHTEY